MKAGDESFSVLVIERDPIASHLFKKSLEEDRNHPYQVDLAVDVPAALRKLKNKSYHVLLVEAESEDDSSALDQLRGLHGDEWGIPIVLMTTSRREKLFQQAKRMGISKLIVKSERNYHELSQLLQESQQNFRPSSMKAERRHRGAAKESRTERLSLAPETVPDRGRFRDALTGLCSHSCIHERILTEFASASRHGHPLSCLMIDVDHFKGINQKFGHQTGDEFLKECGEILFQNCRLTDTVARYGGEAFAVLLPHTDYTGAEELASRLQQIFAQKQFGAGDDPVRLTISIGISSCPEDPIDASTEISSFAEEALSRAKAMGRNRVVKYADIARELKDELIAYDISEEEIARFQKRMSEIANTARRSYLEASKALIQSLEKKDHYTAGHAASCEKYALSLAQAMGMNMEEAEIVRHAALLHDIGKICIPDILLKPSRLSFVEFEAMKQHPYLGYKILKPIRFLQLEAILVLHHHEWYNGEGYPCRLKGNEIPLGARILSIVDAYDTMRLAGGRYKQTCTAQDAASELIACAGSQFDPLVVKAFIEVLILNKELEAQAYDQRRLEQAVQKVSAPPPSL